MNYYPHHIGDYKRDTAHLTLLEHGVYRQLLDLYYLSEEPIPLETDWVIRRLSARTDEEQNAIQSVLNDFFEACEEGYRHRRCDAEITAYQAKADTARANGIKGGRPKKTHPVISGLPNKTKAKANQEPITNNQEPIEREGKKTKRFSPPSLEQVTNYIRERGSKVNPERFIDFYQSKNWTVGKSKMSDWQAAVRTWEQREEQYGTGKRITHADDIRGQAARAIAALDARNRGAGDRAIRSDRDALQGESERVPDL